VALACGAWPPSGDALSAPGVTADRLAGGASPIRGLAGVLIWTEAARFETMRRFYRDTLGLSPRSDRSDFVSFDWGGVRVSVGVHDRVRGESVAPLRVMINFQVDDIQGAHARLASAGVRFSRPPEREAWGGWVATFADPDGNTLQLMQLPATI
jgi:predicted enzyme related to lactoylglutathione lyase